MSENTMNDFKNSHMPNIWVFGYGSLCWDPGFEFGVSIIGCIRGYVRRFWQGNSTHRGNKGQVGRVATLVKEEKGETWGVAYQVTGQTALKYLNNREVALGGYSKEVTDFHPRNGCSRSRLPVLVYVATPQSSDWVGPAPMHEIAEQIARSSGARGHNVEYLLRLAAFMRNYVPEGYDEHLATLETLVLLQVKAKKMCLKRLMGEPCRSQCS